MLKIELFIDATFDLNGDIVIDVSQDLGGKGEPADTIADITLPLERIFSRTLNLDAEDREFVDNLRTTVARRMRGVADKINPRTAAWISTSTEMPVQEDNYLVQFHDGRRDVLFFHAEDDFDVDWANVRFWQTLPPPCLDA